MLELDLVLEPFLDQHFDALHPDDQLLYVKLLDEQDPDLFQWLVNASEPDEPGLRRIVSLIREKTL